MNVQVIDTDKEGFTLCLGIDANASDLGTLQLAFGKFTEDSHEQARLAEIDRPTGEQQLAYRRAADSVAGDLQSLGSLLLPVAKALAELPEGEADPEAEVETEADQADVEANTEEARALGEKIQRQLGEIVRYFEMKEMEEQIEQDAYSIDAHDYTPAYLDIPPLYSCESRENPLAMVKLFTPWTNWTWYIQEYDPEQDLAFGLVVGFETELGYFSISELREINGPAGLKIERDVGFRPTPVTQLREWIAKWGEDGGPYKSKAEPHIPVHTLVFTEREGPREDGDDENTRYGHVGFCGDRYVILSHYVDQDETRYGDGWVVYYKHDHYWVPLFEPCHQGLDLGEIESLEVVVAEAERVLGIRIALEGAPADLPDSYPPFPWREQRQEGGAVEKVEAEAEPEPQGEVLTVAEAIAAVEEVRASDGIDAALEKAESIRIPERETLPLPDPWTVEDVRFLLVKLEEGSVLVADSELGVRTIHEVAGPVEHLGFGLMHVHIQSYTVDFDAGGAMQQTPSGQSWTFVRVKEGEFPYNFEDERGKLWLYLISAATEGEGEPVSDAFCPRCGQAWAVHNDDGSCVQDEPEPEVRVLAFGDNDVQVYFEGGEYLLLNPYSDRDGTRYGGGWTWHYRDESTGMEWRCLEDPDRGPNSQVGSYSLREVVAYAERVTGLRFELTGAPENLPDSYPELPETLTHAEADAILERETMPDVNPAQTLTVGMLDAAERVMKAQVVDDEPRDVPCGAAHIAFFPDLDTVPDGLIWTADIQSYQNGGGAEALRTTFEYLKAVAAFFEEMGFQVHQVTKCYDDDTFVHLDRGSVEEPPNRGEFSCEIAPWGKRELSVSPVKDWGVQDRLEALMRNVYATRSGPVDWDLPGLDLAQRLRVILASAYDAVSASSDVVLFPDLQEAFWEAVEEDEILKHYGSRWLLSLEDWVKSLGLDVVKPEPPKRWTYVPQDKRKGKLAQKYEGDPVALFEALGNDPNQARLNCLLSALYDTGTEIPARYIPADKAGAPARKPEPVEQPTAEASSREPWQMSQRHYQETKAVRVAGGVPILNVADGEEHRQLVEEALGRGEIIPIHVFKDYPDLWQPWTWTLERWLQMEHTIQRTGPDMRYHAPTGKKTLWPGTTSREDVKRKQHDYEVRVALVDGKDVPDEVLAGYPDLETGQEAAQAETEPAADEAAPKKVRVGHRVVPYGTLYVVYLDSMGVPGGIAWTGDVDTFRARGGADDLRGAFEYFDDVKAYVEAEYGLQAVVIYKSHDSDTRVVALDQEGVEIPRGYTFANVPGWQAPIRLYFRPGMTLPRNYELDHAFQESSAEPDVPPEWNAPGIHLAQRVREVLRQAHTNLLDYGDIVYDDELMAEFRTLAKENDILGLVNEVRLLEPARWIGSLGVEVTGRLAWTYVPPDERKGKLAQQYEGDHEALKEALEQGPSGSRLNLLLSALADTGWPVPEQYIKPAAAGAPSNQAKPYRPDQLLGSLDGEHVLHLTGTQRHRTWRGDVLMIDGTSALRKGEEGGGPWTAEYRTRDYGPEYFRAGKEIAVKADTAEECAQKLQAFLRSHGHQTKIVLQYPRAPLDKVEPSSDEAVKRMREFHRMFLTIRDPERPSCELGWQRKRVGLLSTANAWCIGCGQVTNDTLQVREPGDPRNEAFEYFFRDDAPSPRVVACWACWHAAGLPDLAEYTHRLAELYQEWLVVTGGEVPEDRDTGPLILHGKAARTLVLGGEDAEKGADFRRYCRIRLSESVYRALSGQTYHLSMRREDLEGAVEAFNRGFDFPAPENWACIAQEEPEVDRPEGFQDCWRVAGDPERQVGYSLGYNAFDEVLLRFEDGVVMAFSPHQLFPAERTPEEDEPYTVVVSSGKVTGVITPAWLYRQWQLHQGAIREDAPDDEETRRVYDAAARRMFREGEAVDAAFCRFCRCAVQGALLTQEREAWERGFESGADFAASPGWRNWVPYIGDKTPEPQFEIGDVVHYTWTDEPDTERRSVSSRQWREYEGEWHYKVSGKFWPEKSLVAADPKGASAPAEEGEPELTVAVDAETLESIHATYSAKLIADHNRIAKPFTVEGADGLWICTGAHGDKKLKCYQVVPREEYEGETDAKAYYAGRVVTYRKQEYVMTDRRLWVTLDESAPEPAPEEADLTLAHLYRDWLSVTNGDESAYPSEETLAKYQRWAEELVVGGEREREGTEFRRFCRVRLEAQGVGLDLDATATAYRNKVDYPAMDGWECLEETDEHFLERSWEAGRKPQNPCVRCGRRPDDAKGWVWACGTKTYLCPACHEDVLEWAAQRREGYKQEARENDRKMRQARAAARKKAKADAGGNGKQASQPKLPDGIPAVIEIDLGRSKGWARATALTVKGKWLHYRLEASENGNGKGKVQVIGRDILWREAAQAGGVVQ